MCKVTFSEDASCTALAENLTILASNDSSAIDDASLGENSKLIEPSTTKEDVFRESARKRTVTVMLRNFANMFNPQNRVRQFKNIFQL